MFSKSKTSNDAARCLTDVGNEPLFEVEDELQSLVPTFNDILNPTEPEQEVKDLQEVEQYLLNYKYQCTDCGTEDHHASGLCKQIQEVYSPEKLMAMESVTEREVAARNKPKYGVPQGAPACAHHHEKLLESLGKKAAHYQPDAPVPGSSNSCLSQSALLPICSGCFQKNTLHTEGQPMPVLNACLCATAITSMECWMCAVQRIDFTKFIRVEKLTKTLDSGMEVLTCDCGSLVGPTEQARMCAGCNGIVTLPATTISGEETTFHANSTVKRVIRPAMRFAAPLTRQNTRATPVDQVPSGPPKPNGQQKQQRSYRTVAPQQQKHRVFTAAEVSRFRRSGLNIASCITDKDHKVISDPRLRLAKLVERLQAPIPALQTKAIDDILIVCGFGIMELTKVSETLAAVFDGSVTADNLEFLVGCALDIDDVLESIEAGNRLNPMYKYENPRDDGGNPGIEGPSEPMEDTKMADV